MKLKKLFSLLLPLLLTACAASVPSLPQDNLVVPGFRQPQTASLIVLLPVEVEAEELRLASPMLMHALHQRLVGAGYQVVALDQGSFDAIWAQELEVVGGIYDPNTGALRQRELLLALGRLAQRVSADTHAAMLVRPQLVLRGAEIAGMSAVWDGQQRRVAVFGAGGDTVTHKGSTLGLSVGLDMFAADGELVMRTHGGIALPFRVNVQSGKNEVRSDLFANDKDVADGVAIALAPFLKNDPRAETAPISQAKAN